MNPARSAKVIRKVDRYELLEEVGSGGMAVVYRGRDSALDREVAVKLLHPHLAARAEARARFSREARAVARLSHPNIVEIYDYAGDAAVESFLVTEFVRGRTLRAYAEQVGIAFPEVAALLVRALADALVHAHGNGVIHRDLKPENVLVLEDGGRRAVKLVDFGIARLLASDERMTMTGALVGSPNHMAPEIIEGREADARSDLFSLGTILYWLAVGKLPFAAPNPTATLRRVVLGEFEEPRTASPLCSDELAAVIARCLALDPADRHASATELRQALDEALAAAGLADPPAELAAFLADPAGYQAALRPRLVAALSGRAAASLDQGATARALRLWNQVLALDPSNQPVLRQLAGLERRTRLRRAARRAAAALLALALAGGAVALALRLRGRTPVTPIAATAVPAHRSGEPAEPAAEPSPAAAGPPAAAPPRPRPSPAPSPAPVITVQVRPYAQRALLDGNEVARDAQQLQVSLDPGRPHRLRLEHACCSPFVRDFAADEVIPQPLELRVPLQPLPALLRVQADAGAQVWVAGRPAGSAEESQRLPIQVAVPPGGDSAYEGQVEIRVEQPGKSPYVTQARIRAGTELTVVAAEAGAAP